MERGTPIAHELLLTDMVWQWKLQVSFAEYSLFYRALLQKRPMILSMQLTEAMPYQSLMSYSSTDVVWLRLVASIKS